MPQHDFIIANNLFPLLRQDINNALAAIATWQSGSTAPATTYAFMRWADTSTSPATLRMRNAANTAWIVMGRADAAYWGITPADIGAAALSGSTFTGGVLAPSFQSTADITVGGDTYSTGRFYSYSSVNGNVWLDRDSEGAFTLGGNSSNYYPVLFRVREFMTSQASSSRLKIYRSDVNYNGTALGSFDCEIRFAPFNGGQQPSRVEIDRYIVGQGIPFHDPLGDVIDGTSPTMTRNNELVVWLKGGVTYFFRGLDQGYTWDLYQGNPSGGSVTAANGTTYNSISTQTQKVLKARTRDNVPIPNYCAFLSRSTPLGLAGENNYFLFNSTTVRQYDTFNSTFNSWIPSISGLYKFTVQTSFYTTGGTNPTSHFIDIYVRKNDVPQVRLVSNTVGVNYINTAVSANGTGLLFVNAGEAITFSCNYSAVGGSSFAANLLIESVVIEQLDIYQK
jgi:hypothetical protein